MPSTYLPNRDAEFQLWQFNFLTYCGANLSALGLTAADLTGLTTDQTKWKASYQTHLDAMHAAEAATQDKKAMRALFTVDIRALVNRLQARPQTTDAQRAALGISLRDTTRTPVPPPSTVPVAAIDTAVRLRHTVSFRDAATPSRRSRPVGSVGAEVYMTIVPPGQSAPADAAAYRYVAMDSASPFERTFDATETGKTACYLLRWINATGEAGPWSDPAAATIAA